MTIAIRESFPYRYDEVGSLLRPEKLKQARDNFRNNKIDEYALRRVENKEIDRIVEKQVEIGLKAVTDGEFRRSWWHLDFLAGLNGTQYFIPQKGYKFQGEETRSGGIKIIDKVAYNPDHPFFRDFKYLNSIVPDGITAKQTIPSPSVLFPNEQAEVFDEYYNGDFNEFLNDTIEAYKRTVQHFYDLGCRYLQLDDTSWGMWASFSKGTLSPELRPFAEATVKAINSIADSKPDDLTLTMHVCKGNYDSHYAGGVGAYDSVSPYLAQLHIDGYFLEYDDNRAGGFEPLKLISENGRQQRVVIGIVTSKRPDLENIDFLRGRIEDASQYIALENLCISPQCGFASTEEGNRLTEEDQWNKLNLVIDTAKSVWKD